MGAVTRARRVMAGLLVLGVVLAVVGAVLGLDEGAGRGLGLAGVAALLAGAGLGGWSLVPTAPLWLRVVVTAGAVGLGTVVVSLLGLV